MSLATLKKKTQTKYNNMSVGSKTGFSINGTHRSQGYVGQTSLSRSLPRTLMKGNVAIGHGGCCGKFRKMPIVQSAVISLENPNVVKSSVLGTSGMISTKYQWIKRPQPYTSVKPDNNNNNNSQSDYITYLIDKTLNSSEYAKSDILLVYPPLNSVTKTGTSNVNNKEYGNGSYITTLSSGSFTGLGPFYISSTKTNNNRIEFGNLYNGTGNTITTTGVYITNVSGISYDGQWVQIEFPYKIQLNRYSFVPSANGSSNVIKKWVLVGLNDDNNWKLIDNNSIVTYNNNETIYFSINPNSSYKIYRFIIISGFTQSPSLFELKFHSYDKYYCAKEVNTTTISNCCNKKLVKTTTNKPGLNYNYAIPCGEYMKRLINCRTQEDMFYVATTNNKQPFAGFN